MKFKNNLSEASDEADNPVEELLHIEKRLKSKKKISRQRFQRSKIDIIVDEEPSEIVPEDIEFIPELKKDSDSDPDDSIQEDHEQPDVVKGSNVAKKIKSNEGFSTANQWQDLDLTQAKAESPMHFPVVNQTTSWSHDLVLGQRFLNARLAPTTQQHAYPSYQNVTWTDSQVKIVSSLIYESNALLEMFDQVSLLLGPDIKLHNVTGRLMF